MEKPLQHSLLDTFIYRGPIRDSVLEIFREVLTQAQTQGWRTTSSLVSRKLREMRNLHSKERRVVFDTLYDLIRKLRHLSVLTGAKRPSAEQLYYSWILEQLIKNSTADSLLHGEELELYMQKALNDDHSFTDLLSSYHLSVPFLVKTVIRQISMLEKQDQQDLDVPNQANLLGEVLSYPTWLVQRFIESYGFLKTKEILEQQNQRAPLTIRVNAYKESRAQVAKKLQEQGIPVTETTLSTWGLILQTQQNVYGLSLFQEGFFEIQDEGSQLIAELVAPPPGGLVIDACAGAGGKTLAIGAIMANKGRILALDIDKIKLEELRKRVRRSGLTNVQALWTDKQNMSHRELAHRVLCDVPCSGVGVLRRNPETRWALQKQDIEELKIKQRAILEQYSSLVMDGGRLIYSTCTLLPEENEQIIQGFLADHPEFILMPVKEIWGLQRAAQVGDGNYLRTFPKDPEGPDGFFAAVLRKKSN